MILPVRRRQATALCVLTAALAALAGCGTSERPVAARRRTGRIIV
ncbi:hypothetical protein [Streptomyces sp. AK04-3B]|nr:hypothetical protein [Streptomyces sp. AK04-3B]MDX3802922.1 hypothetical protein [Streptomyces sp. AK04-3B]